MRTRDEATVDAGDRVAAARDLPGWDDLPETLAAARDPDLAQRSGW